MSEQKIVLNPDDVISLNAEEDKNLITHRTFKAEEFIDKLSTKVEGTREKQLKWTTDGVDCTILAPNQGWQKGKIRLRVEFIPDTPESPLDEIRQTLG